MDWDVHLEAENCTGSLDAGDAAVSRAAAWADAAVQQLCEYFTGLRRGFDVPLVPRGTAFQQAVWAHLLSIPPGETRTYQQVAAAIGRPRAVRAVGQANRANPIPILIPCHRVVGSQGKLVGYAGSQVHLKQYLLTLEQAEPNSWAADGGPAAGAVGRR
ncbi:hypothetical protein GCM10025857_15720 [Alicyclobacillus contaminans]|nr:hypothetical protein GCM10025857_15720 [Alicyclobacillus contaminans]